MSTEVMRTVSMLIGVGTLSLFCTVLAYGAANAASLKWDGSFCAARCQADQTIAQQRNISKFS